jgi:hypothetical protein
MASLKKIVKNLLPNFILRPLQEANLSRQVNAWKNDGAPIPPPYTVKQFAVIQYQKKYRCTTFIETGTYLGDMIEAQKRRFDKLISIELAESLFQRSKARFVNDPHIEILQGDSGKVLPSIMKNINEPVMFWLDGHYSQGETAKGDLECPIIAEIDAILVTAPNKHPHVILIDDARDFIGKNDYPTIEGLDKYIKQINPAYQLEVKDDIIRFTIPI